MLRSKAEHEGIAPPKRQILNKRHYILHRSDMPKVVEMRRKIHTAHRAFLLMLYRQCRRHKATAKVKASTHKETSERRIYGAKIACGDKSAAFSVFNDRIAILFVFGFTDFTRNDVKCNGIPAVTESTPTVFKYTSDSLFYACNILFRDISALQSKSKHFYLTAPFLLRYQVRATCRGYTEYPIRLSGLPR